MINQGVRNVSLPYVQWYWALTPFAEPPPGDVRSRESTLSQVWVVSDEEYK